MAKIRVGTNLSGYFEAQPFLNLFHWTEGFDARATVGPQITYGHNSDGVFLNSDSDGYPQTMTGTNSAAGKTFDQIYCTLMGGLGWDPTNPPARYRTGTYVFLYTGGSQSGGSGESFTFSGDATVTGTAPGRITMTVGNSGQGIRFQINAVGNPYVRNFRLVYKGSGSGPDYDGETLHNLGEIFNPDFLARTDPYQAVRFMDWMRALDNDRDTWAERPQPTQLFWNQLVPAAGGLGVPVEAMVALCNRINADGWFSIPVLSDDTYVTNFATVVRDGNPSAPLGMRAALNSNLKAFVEFGNEIWNNGYNLGNYQALATAAFPTAPNNFARGLAYQALRSVQMWAIWKTVFAAAPTRVIRALCWQLANGSGTANTLLNFTAGTYGGNASLFTGTVASHMDSNDVGATAPYFGVFGLNTSLASLDAFFNGNIIDNPGFTIIGSITNNVLTVSNTNGLIMAPGQPLSGNGSGTIIDQLNGSYGGNGDYSVTPQPNRGVNTTINTPWNNVRTANALAWIDMQWCVGAGISYAMYEGGWSYSSSNVGNQNIFTAAQLDPRLYTALTQFINSLDYQSSVRSNPNAVFFQETDIGPPVGGGFGFNWGTLENVLQTHSSRYDANVDFIGAGIPQAYHNVTLTVTATGLPLTLSPSSVPAGQVGAAYSPQTITASGGTAPYTFVVFAGALPNGLSLTTGGVLSGTPTVANIFNFTIRATDSVGVTGTRAYSLTIAANPVNITLQPTTLANGTVGTFYSQTITATGGAAPYTFSATGNVPNGVILSSGGVLQGTPTVSASFSFTVTATDNSGAQGTRNYNVVVATSGQNLVVMHTVGVVDQPNTAALAAMYPIGSLTEMWFTIDLNAVSNSGDPSMSNFPPSSPAFISAHGVFGNHPVTVDAFLLPSLLGFSPPTGEAGNHNMFWAQTGTANNHSEIHAPDVDGMPAGFFSFQCRDNDNHIPDPLLVPKGSLPLNINRMADMSLWNAAGDLRKITMIYYDITTPTHIHAGEVISATNFAEILPA